MKRYLLVLCFAAASLFADAGSLDMYDAPQGCAYPETEITSDQSTIRVMMTNDCRKPVLLLGLKVNHADGGRYFWYNPPKVIHKGGIFVESLGYPGHGAVSAETYIVESELSVGNVTPDPNWVDDPFMP